MAAIDWMDIDGVSGAWKWTGQRCAHMVIFEINYMRKKNRGDSRVQLESWLATGADVDLKAKCGVQNADFEIQIIAVSW